ncbi:MAG: NAD(+)/NADH kinase [Chloroflexi bacterium]|nr:NAD(+)/NADH kinase [Chloroflexota bacterium]
MSQRVGILYQPRVARAVELNGDLGRSLAQMGVEAISLSVWEEAEVAQRLVGCDLAVCLGGDGSLLRAARAAARGGVPIAGVHLGRLGFMAELEPNGLGKDVARLLGGEGWIEERMMLQVALSDGTGEHRNLQPMPPTVAFPALCLNDVFVGRGAVARMVRVEVTVDGEALGAFRCDGVLVASPTGSTGYALAAGGPVLHPQLEALVVESVAAHLSRVPAIVVPGSSSIGLRMETDHEAILSLDGQMDVLIASGTEVLVERSHYRARFLRLRPPSYFYTSLQARLG